MKRSLSSASPPLMDAGVWSSHICYRLLSRQQPLRRRVTAPYSYQCKARNTPVRQHGADICAWDYHCNPRATWNSQQQRARHVSCQGILDHYRREKGLLPEADLQIPANVDPATREAILDAEQTEDEDDYDVSEDLVCPVECVIEIFTETELQHQLNSAPPDTLVVVDFYKRGCGACRYIMPGFVKMCKASGSAEERAVIFLKHNVVDQEEQLSDLAEALAIKVVPKFHFYKDGKLLEQISSRDRRTVALGINKHAGFEVLPVDHH